MYQTFKNEKSMPSCGYEVKTILVINMLQFTLSLLSNDSLINNVQMSCMTF